MMDRRVRATPGGNVITLGDYSVAMTLVGEYLTMVPSKRSVFCFKKLKTFFLKNTYIFSGRESPVVSIPIAKVMDKSVRHLVTIVTGDCAYLLSQPKPQKTKRTLLTDPHVKKVGWEGQIDSISYCEI